METMAKFEYFPKFASLAYLHNIKNNNKALKALTMNENEICLGQRQVGKRSYHIFYLDHKQFCVYYHGGGTDAMCCSKSLDELVDYVNKLSPEDFEGFN